ncbi:glycerophosphodiester phosphodiesterase family protein [Nocardioides sp. Bht2]|uniref:glycerophosphodiester phosphodiesterase family protein n=1 Tax=Nocardioides sp. Bht2 TaxID=3392297 RepID=UPI0039B3EA7B
MSPTISSLVVTPAVVAHRGACGLFPEHTLEAYRAAIRMGVDDIELDLVATRDGVLISRHDVELSATTDIADRPEFARRRTTRSIDGERQRGWFVDDFTLAELRTLRARERFPKLRRKSAARDDLFALASLDDVLAMVAVESQAAGRSVGVMLELKHPTYFARRGLDLVEPLLATLRRHGLDHPRSRVTVMAFETTVLTQIAARSRVAITQLLTTEGAPYDLMVAGEPTTYAELASPAGLARIDEYADGVGVHRELVLNDDGVATSMVRDAHRHWLTVHVWTLRRENRFLPAQWRTAGLYGNLAGYADAYLSAGVDGLITDHPNPALYATKRHLAAMAVARPVEA